MSVLSDDTDVLLLIPPDFFLIPSDSDEETLPPKKIASESLIVSDLITQVNDLEGRICLIENRCLKEGEMTGNLQQLRHYGSADALNCSHRSSLNTRSLHATPIKSYSPWKCGELTPQKRASFPLEMRENILTSTDYVVQRDRDEQLLKEIDQFFKHRKNNDEEAGEKGAELTKPDCAPLSAAVFNLKKVNDLLKKLDETQKEVEEKAKLKEIAEIETEDSLDFAFADKGLDKAPASEQPKNVKRSLSFAEEGKRDEGKDKGAVISSEEFHCGEDSFGSVCKSRRQSESDKNPQNFKSHELTNLMSLSSLWGSSGNVHRSSVQADEDQVIRQRLQEEKCRRQHCESLIQNLQLRLLEEQQKVAVAVKVDQEKDQAISKLTEGWSKLVGHWRDLENQRNNLAKKLLSDREKFKTEISAAYQTVKRYETELSKALDLAHGYKEKCEASEKEKKAVRANAAKDVENLRIELKDVTEKLRAEECKSERLEKALGTKDELLNQGKARLLELQSQMREGKKTLKELQSELETVKAERERLEGKLSEERSRTAAAEQGRKALQLQNEELKKKEKALKEDLKTLTEQMEKVKVELKEFYQEQVESIVQEKLKEFQEQLAAAEKGLHAEIELREKTVTEMAVKQVQQIAEKHLMEVSALEEKHKEELESLRKQANQKEERIRELEKKLEQCSNNKTIIAQRLHSVMEAQWQEALKIITASSPQQKSPPNTARSESEKSVPRQNTFTMTSSESSPPFCQEGPQTFREEPKNSESLTYRVDETPQKISSDGLKKYIQASEGSSSQLTSDLSKYSDCVRHSKDLKPSWK
ncbi:UNVERIFIED_CONTAM: hypothetical protein PYX00_003082 [Menopon gallinae]|uniref:Centrobin n=1 Tax=Menopon gallinae TaxID=328185 RepID=A0AAW2HZI0_9NEOP